VELLSWRSVKDLTGDGGVVKSITKEGDGFKKPKDRDEVLGARPPARARAARDALPAPQLPRLAAWVYARMRQGLRQGRDRGGHMNTLLWRGGCGCSQRTVGPCVMCAACQQTCQQAFCTSEGIRVRAAAPACRQGLFQAARVQKPKAALVSPPVQCGTRCGKRAATQWSRPRRRAAQRSRSATGIC